MKALDEVIKAHEMCIERIRQGEENCPAECPFVSCCCPERMVMILDALHYLKEYQEKQNILKGKWQVISVKGETWGICSNCNFKQKAGELNFCPNCGADMREDIPMEYFENGGI